MKAGSLSIVCVLISTVLLVSSPLHAGSSTEDFAQFDSPVRLDIAAGAQLLVTDYTAQKVVTLVVPTMKIVRSFKVNGSPLSVAWAGGIVLVGNETSKQIEAYNPGGMKLFAFSGAGDIIPADMAVDVEAGLVMVVDTLAKDVKVFSIDGVYLYSLTRPGALINPTALTLDPNRERVYVSDYGSFSNSFFRRPKAYVRVFNYNGTSVTNISGYFVRPQGLTLDHRGFIYVAESLEGRIEVFDVTTGKFVTRLTGDLSLPLDIVFDAQRRLLYATSNRTGRIVTFEKLGGVQ